MIILKESQSKPAMRRVVSGIFQDPEALDAKARIRLTGTFLKHDGLFGAVKKSRAGCYEFLSVAAVHCDGDAGEIALSCVDDSDGRAPGMTWREIARAAKESGMDTARCDKFVIKFAPETDVDAPIDVMRPGYELSFSGSVLDVKFDYEWWVTDSRFFEDWVQDLDNWRSSRSREDMYRDIGWELNDIATRTGRLDDVRHLADALAPRYDVYISPNSYAHGVDDDDYKEDVITVLGYVIADLKHRLPASKKPSRTADHLGDQRTAKAFLALMPHFNSDDEAWDWFVYRGPRPQG